MKAVTLDGQSQECHDFREGDRGLVLLDRTGERVGYVPDENLARIERFRVPVSSSSIRSIGYHPETDTLEVAFHSGGVYRYRDVPRDVYESFHGADSRGRFFHDRIRGQYRYERLA